MQQAPKVPRAAQQWRRRTRRDTGVGLEEKFTPPPASLRGALRPGSLYVHFGFCKCLLRIKVLGGSDRRSEVWLAQQPELPARSGSSRRDAAPGIWTVTDGLSKDLIPCWVF